MQDPPKGFVDHPYPYHHELELVIENVTNLGYGIARQDGWVIQVPFTMSGERINGFSETTNYSMPTHGGLDSFCRQSRAECELKSRRLPIPKRSIRDPTRVETQTGQRQLW